MAKMYDKPIDKNIPWDGNTVTNDLPVKGSRVEEFIKDQLNHRIGILYYDQQSNKQLAFSDIEDRDKYLEDPIENAYLLLGSFDAPANYTAEITLSSPSSVSLLKGQKGNYIEFTFDIKNLGGASVGDSVLCTYTFTSSSKKEEVREVYTSGQSVKFLVDEYLTGSGSIVVSISIVGRTTMAATMVGVTYNVIDLELTSDFDFTTAKESTTTLEVPYVVKGVGVKYMEFYIDGVKYGEDDTITDATGIRTKYIDLVNMAPGRHSLQLRSYIISNGEKYYSYTLYRDFAIIGESVVTVMISTTIPDLVTDNLTISGTQYETISFDFGLYDSRQRILDILFKVNDSEVSTVSTSNGAINSFSYVLNTEGESTISISCEDMIYEIGLDINKSAIEIEDPTEGLVMRLSAKGRSNSDSNRWRWTDSGYTATLNNFAYTDNQGWFNDVLVISGGATVDIDIAPLASNWATTGGTIIFDIETSDVDDSDAILCECMDDNTSAGFRITPNEALIQSSGGAKVKTNYRERERLQLAFIVNKTSGVENAKTVLIVNNGKNERATNFSITDTFACPKTLTLGDSNGMVTLKLYSIAVYNRALTVEEAFNSWVLSTSDMATIIQRNDIYADGTNTVSPDKVVSRVPVLLITGDMPKLIEANDKKTNIHADVEFRNNQDPSKNFTATGMKFYRQGTSSLSYKIPNLNGELDDQSVMYDYEGKEIAAYSFKDKAQPVRLWCFKADVAESSGSHNVGIARLWNKVMYNTKLDTKYLQEGEDQYVLRTNAQRAAIQANYPYDVRTTIDGFPIVVFYRLNKNSEWVCMGQYNFNNDKKTESVFGFKDIPGFDNTNVECWEGLNNTEPIGLYTDISEFDTKWDKAFEARYPDGSTKVNNLKTFATWVNSTKDDINKFSTEKYQHLDVWKVAAYYVYLMRFGAVDQPVKNSMTTTEDGQHYFFINYDNDTINGKRNDGPLVYGPFIDRQTIDEEIGEYAYAGHDSVLWNNLEADQDFMNKVAIIDNAMYAAGLSYSGVIEEFDTNQVDKWCEKLGNINGDYKYLKPFREENNAQYLPMLQGDLKSHRHWWLSNRFEMFDAMWVSGNYKSKAIVIKAVGNTQDKGFTLTAGKDLRYGYGINNDPIQYNIPLNFGDDHRFTFTRNLGIGDPVRIYAANCVQKLQLGEMTDILVEVNMSDAVDTLLGSKIKGIYLGSTVDDSIVNNAVDGINGLTQLIGLEELDIRGFKGIKTLELTTLKNLHKFWAAGSGLNSFIPAVGANLDYVTLPTTIQALRLDKTNINSIVYTPNTTLREVVMKNVTGMDVKSFVLGWHNSLSSAETDLLSTASLTLEGINWTGMTAAEVLKLADFGYHSLKGKVTLTSITQEEIDALSAAFGANVFQPTGKFVIDAPASVFLTGPTTILSGETAYYKAITFPVTEGAPFIYQIVGVTANTDSDGKTIYKYGSATLYEESGKLVTVESPTNTTFTMQAIRRETGTYIETNITITKRTYPSSVDIEGNFEISSTGDKLFQLVFDTPDYTGTIKSVAWGIDCEPTVAEISNYESNGVLTINHVPDSYSKNNITVTVIFSNGLTLTKTKTIIISSIVPILSSETNPIAMNLVYKAGWASSPDYMTEDEALAITDIGTVFQRTSLMTFNEFKHFLNVQEIPSAAFMDSPLREITIPDNVKTIGDNAFLRCYYIDNITFGKNLQTINSMAFKNAFNYNTAQSSLCLDFRNTKLQTIGYNAFNGATIGKLYLPASINSFGSSAFYLGKVGNLYIDDLSKWVKLRSYRSDFPLTGDTNIWVNGQLLTSVDIPEGTTTLYAIFAGSTIENITLPNSLTTIYSDALNGCRKLKSLYIPASVRKIESKAFSYTGITEVVVDEQNTTYDSRGNCNGIVETATNTLIFGCSNTLIPDSIVTINDYSFQYSPGQQSVTYLTIPEGVTKIGYGSLQIDFVNIHIPSTLVECSYPFSYQTKPLVNLYVKDLSKWLSLGSRLFEYVTEGHLFVNGVEVTHIDIPESLTSVNGYAFNTLAIESLSIHKNVTTVDFLSGLTNLKSITCKATTAPKVYSSTFGNSTDKYTGRNTYNTGENILYIPQGATGYDTGYWLDPLQNAEKCGFSIEYLPDPDLEIGSWITIDQTITDPATMITGDVNGEHIQLIRNNSHRYLGKYTAEGTMTLCQLDDNNSTKYADGNTADLTGAEGDVFMKMPRFWYRAKEMSINIWGIGFYYGTESPGENWKEWDDTALIGVYEAYSTDSKVYSRSGVDSSGDISQDDFKAYARNRGTGFQLVDWQMHCIMGILYYAQYGHTDCQEKIGNGTSSYTKLCGQTNANGMNDTKGTSPVSGLNDAGVDGNTQSINFWGLENWWGNKYEWIDNVVVDAYEWKITEPDGTVRTPGYASDLPSGFIIMMMFGDNCDLIPIDVSDGSSTTGFCDCYYGSDSSDLVVFRSSSHSGSGGGVSYVAAESDPLDALPVGGSRLAFRGQCVEAESVATFKSLTVIG